MIPSKQKIKSYTIKIKKQDEKKCDWITLPQSDNLWDKSDKLNYPT